jgi:hypothetical protein
LAPPSMTSRRLVIPSTSPRDSHRRRRRHIGKHTPN